MGHAFELPHEGAVGATPEEVWDAISTGPGITSWFMGRSEVTDGVVRTAFGGFELPASTVTEAVPPHRFAHSSDKTDDGRFVAYEFLVEGRERGSTVVRMVTSGFLPGDDWQDEFEAMSRGLEMYFATLVEYLNHFAGRTARPVTVFGPPVRDWARAWDGVYAELGGRPAIGDVVRLGPVEGVVYHRNTQTLGVRAADGLYRVLQGFGGSMIASHLRYDAGGDVEPAWREWLERLHAAGE
ncbi:SRPBCC domain-containing protein [Actinomadura sp. ATCC 31491]|uniref:SRPBCC domain-containing protein n=1 Tax=Actinomadura luzonensis TaxID=2805427 RepID=A0ABT0FV01_9ACTN|nr:SRPBCC domain-containing protein [Actinomadura luzonensis]MCK2216156.1 SRPBCC domain-containing protein [Actinomadura luzonensis]